MSRLRGEKKKKSWGCVDVNRVTRRLFGCPFRNEIKKIKRDEGGAGGLNLGDQKGKE